MQETQLRHFYPEHYGTGGVKVAADAARAQHYDWIDAHLSGRSWLLGEGRTVADFLLFIRTRWGRFPSQPRATARTCAPTSFAL